jgi:hypothetical protein
MSSVELPEQIELRLLLRWRVAEPIEQGIDYLVGILWKSIGPSLGDHAQIVSRSNNVAFPMGRESVLPHFGTIADGPRGCAPLQGDGHYSRKDKVSQRSTPKKLQRAAARHNRPVHN